jgi:hypothetical protein
MPSKFFCAARWVTCFIDILKYLRVLQTNEGKILNTAGF